MPCSPCHGAGPGWLSEPAGSKHTEQGSCPAACCQQLLHTWAQLRHSWAQLGTAHHDLTRAHRRVQHLLQPWSEGLGSGPRAGLGPAAHREPLWGGIMQHQGRSMQSQTHPWPNQGPKDSRLGPRQAGFCTLTDKLPRNEKSSGFCPTLKPSAGALGAGQGSCCRQGVPGCSQGGSLGSAALAPSNNNKTAQSLSHFYLHHCTAHFPRMRWNVVGQTPIAHIHELNISGKEDKTQRVTTGPCGGTCNNSNYWQ